MQKSLAKNNKNTLLMTQGNIWKLLITFSIPLIIGNLLQQMYNTADSIIVGNFVGSNGLAAVGSGTALINLIIAFAQGASVGAGVVVSQYIGADKKDKIKISVHTSICISIILGLILSLLGIFASPSLLIMMKTPKVVLKSSILYLQIYCGGLIFNVIYNMATGILNAAGNSKKPLVYLAIASFTNIILDLLKFAHVLPPSNAYCGKIYTVNIGIDEKHYESFYPQTITKKDIKKNFTKRDFNSNKGSFGHQLNICGSYLMPGASVICAKAALKTGVGLLKCAFPKSIYPVMTSHLTQPLFKPLCENEAKTISIGALGDVFEDLKWADSVVVGCGLGNNDDIQVVVDQIIITSEVPVILDADGINAVAPFIDIVKDKKAPLIITPHPGEMARLIGESVDYVCSHRLEVAKAFAKENDVIIVLKGANTIVTNGVDVYFNTTGNPGMAMGGTGDMLAGIISSFAAQGIAPIEACKAAVYIHGRCGDIAAQEISTRGMTVDDMIYVLGALMSEFE